MAQGDSVAVSTLTTRAPVSPTWQSRHWRSPGTSRSVAAFDAGITPLLCVTKTDLADPTEVLANFAGLDLRVFRRRSDDFPIEEIREALQ